MQPQAKDGNPRQAGGREFHYVGNEDNARSVRFSAGKRLLRATAKEHANAFQVENAADIRRRGGRLRGQLCG